MKIGEALEHVALLDHGGEGGGAGGAGGAGEAAGGPSGIFDVSEELNLAREHVLAAAASFCGLRDGGDWASLESGGAVPPAVAAFDDQELFCARPPPSTMRALSHLARAEGLFAEYLRRSDLSSGDLVAASWWRFRAASLQQRLFDGPSPSVLALVRKSVGTLVAQLVSNQLRRTDASGAPVESDQYVAEWRAIPRLLEESTSEDDDDVVERMFAAIESNGAGKYEVSKLLRPESGEAQSVSETVADLHAPGAAVAESGASDEDGDLDGLAGFGLSSDDEEAAESYIDDRETLSIERDASARSWLLLELSNFILESSDQFSRVAQALELSCRAAGIDALGVAGSMGVRTLHQQKPTAQLVPYLRRANVVGVDLLQRACNESTNTHAVPELSIGDGVDEDGVFDDPQIRSSSMAGDAAAPPDGNPDEFDVTDASTFEMCLAVTKSEFHRRSHVKDDSIAREQSLALLRLAEQSYVGRKDLHPQGNWAVALATATVRSLLECDITKAESQTGKTRYALRALSRLEAIRSAVYPALNGPSALKSERNQRVRWVWALPAPDEGFVQSISGDLFLSIGDSRSALNSFEAIGKWERVVHCYVLIRQADKAERIVKDELAKAEAEGGVRADIPLLYCLLGEITDSEVWLEKSWEASKGRFARAKRALGRMAFDKGKIRECCDHFRDSLAINPLYHSAWFTYGSALTHADMGETESALQRGIGAYRRCVSLKPDDGMSWNNLAALYLKLGKKRDAYRALGQSLRFMERSWKVWENFLVVCTDLHEYRHAIRAMLHLVTIGSETSVDDSNQKKARIERPDGRSWIDKEILSILIQAVIEDLPDSSDNSTRNYCRKDLEGLLQVIENIHAPAAGDADLWVIFRKYALSTPVLDPEAAMDVEHLLRAATYCEKEWRALTQHGPDHEAWRESPEPLERVLESLRAYAQTMVAVLAAVGQSSAIHENGQGQEHLRTALDKAFSLRTKLNAAIKKTSDVFSGTEKMSELVRLFEEVKQLELDLEKLLQRGS